VNATGAHGGLFNPNAAAVHPARLVRGVADAAERLGATVYEQTTVRSIEPRRVVTDRGTVRAEVVVRATEGYTSRIDGQRRAMLPLGNFMIATEPLADETWAEIGAVNREVFEVMVPMVSYAQRTADHRMAIGGLGAPYTWGSGVPSSPMRDLNTAERLRALLVARFPVLSNVRVTHHWGGVLGVPRDYRPGVGLDRSTGVAWAGGYVGSGVASANAAGRTLADLVTGTASDLTRLPWVNHRSPLWEPEPLRWIGVNGRKLQARMRGVIEDHGMRRPRSQAGGTS
jgi:glycine/D-amino acid oxidase-like deaminating enzyme